MDTTALNRELTRLRSQGSHLIQISNTEWYSLFKDEIRNSIAIEGVFTNRNDLIDVLENNKRTDKQKTAAILGYFESASALYEYAANQYKEGEFSLRISDIRQIHTLLMRYEKDMGFYTGELGEFRKVRVDVTQSTFTPINEHHVRTALELFIKWVDFHLRKKTYTAVQLAAIAHVWFESIHPFRDGNGRVGRILLSYLLIGSGYINIAIKGVSKTDRDHYYASLEKADDVFESLHRNIEDGHEFTIADIDNLLQLQSFDEFIAIVASAIEESIARLKHQDINTLDQEVALPLSDLARFYGYSSDYLRNLINRGKLKGQKKGKTWYVRVKDLAAYVERTPSHRR